MRILPIDPIDRVTGSCYLVHVPERNVRLLVDCGAYQDGIDADLLDDAPFPFNPAALTAVLLTHAHFDHCGRLPRLVQQGFTGSVIATEETIAIAKVVLEDSLKLRSHTGERAAYKQLRWRPYGMSLFARPLSIATDVFVQAHRSGHILGAVSVEIIAGPKERPEMQERVLFSGDIGNNFDGREVQPFLRHIMHPSRSVDLAVMESTYGGLARPPESFDPRHRRSQLRDAVREGVARGGPVIIPVFGVQRAQDVLWDLHVLLAEDPNFLGDAPILHDAPMGLSMHRILREALARDSVSSGGKARPIWLGRHAFRELQLDPDSPEDLSRVRNAINRVFGERPEWHVGQSVSSAPLLGTIVDRMQPRWWRVSSHQREDVVAERRASVVLATGGMCEGGPVHTWLRAWLEDSRATVAFSGYCGKSTLGFEIQELARMPVSERCRLHEFLSLPGTHIRRSNIAAQLHIMSGYSAHADQAGLSQWAFPRQKDGKQFSVARHILITHGEAGARRALREAILNRAAVEGLEVTVHLPRPAGPGFEVGTGEPVPREDVLATGNSRPSEEVTLSEALRELRELRAENSRLRAQLNSTHGRDSNRSL